MKALFVSRAVHRESTAIDTLRNDIRALVARVTHDSRGGALVLSMALGERDVLSSHVESAFKAVGMSHLLVVSGYQVSLVFGAVYVVCMQVRGLFGANALLRALSTWCAFVWCFGYVLLVGSEMSSVRALIAAACLCVSLVLDRAHRFGQRWSAALLLMQVVYPWALFEVGVILTFAALAGIGVGGVLGAQRVWGSYGWVTVCVWLMTSAVTVTWNGSFSCMGILLNLALAAPWSIWNCAVGGIGLCLAALPIPYGTVLLELVAWGNEVVAGAVLWLVGTSPSRDPLEGVVRWSIAAALLTLSACVTWRAARQLRQVSMRAMVR
jgi:competence protein ComEC